MTWKSLVRFSVACKCMGDVKKHRGVNLQSPTAFHVELVSASIESQVKPWDTQPTPARALLTLSWKQCATYRRRKEKVWSVLMLSVSKVVMALKH